jgi:sporulenol synthase
VSSVHQVVSEIHEIKSRLQEKQSSDGSWRFCFEGGPMTDSYMIILLRTLQIHDEDLIRRLTERIAAKQEENGAWKLFPDEVGGNLSAAIEAYYALLFSGHYRANDRNMQAAKQYILSKGGLSEASMLTKVVLALTGQYRWPRHRLIPVELVLFPPDFPVNFYDFVGYARVHIAPILICADRRYAVKTEQTPDLSELVVRTIPEDTFLRLQTDPFTRQIRSFLATIHPRHLREWALRRAEQFMLQRIEPDGTLYSYFTSTFLMIFALLALGYPRTHPVLLRAIKGLRGLLCETEDGVHIQQTTSTVWDTALLAHALQEGGLSFSAATIKKAARYLLSRQQSTYADWAVHNPHAVAGGWGFSDSNTINPDVDDATAALRAIKKRALADPAVTRAWNHGLRWVLSMQNDDGGWPAFEKNTDQEWLRWLPIDGADAASTDPSSADLTGRTLEFLGNHAGFNEQHPRVQKAVAWLIRHQEEDGSWYGRWGITYLYGTWAAVTGMLAVGVSPAHPAVQRAVQWLLKHQNADGGWGESCQSDIVKKYVPLGASTLSQTAWAVDMLSAVFTKPTTALERGVQFLLKAGKSQDWTSSYPTGAGLPGSFYIHYHSYRHIWPLLALSHYQKKFIDSE